MEVKVVNKYIRMSPRKVRPVIKQLSNMEVSQAMNLMKFVKRGVSLDVYKTLKSGKANAQVINPDIKELYIKKIAVDSGPQLKRWKSISRGRASKILKRTTHLTVVLSDQISKGGRG